MLLRSRAMRRIERRHRPRSTKTTQTPPLRPIARRLSRVACSARGSAHEARRRQSFLSIKRSSPEPCPERIKTSRARVTGHRARTGMVSTYVAAHCFRGITRLAISRSMARALRESQSADKIARGVVERDARTRERDRRSIANVRGTSEYKESDGYVRERRVDRRSIGVQG